MESRDGGLPQTECLIRQVAGNRELQQDIMAGRESPDNSRRQSLNVERGTTGAELAEKPPALEDWDKKRVKVLETQAVWWWKTKGYQEEKDDGGGHQRG